MARALLACLLATMTFPTEPPVQAESPEGEIINFRAVRDWVLFGARVARRRKWVVLALTVAMLGLAGLALLVIPSTYHISCRLIAQPHKVLATRADEGRGPGLAALAKETILARENLIGLVRQTNLVEEWEKRRSPPLRLKDQLMGLVRDKPTKEEMTEALADMLEDDFKVWSDGPAIVIQIYWRDREMAYRLVDAAYRSFLEERHVQEVSTIVESTSILEAHAEEVGRGVETAMNELRNLREAKKAAPGSRGSPPEAPAALPAAALKRPEPAKTRPDPGKERRLAELPLAIKAKERILEELESFRRKRLTELQTKLEEQRAIYTDAHPAVADIKQAIAVASNESPQASRLRAELNELRGELDRLGTSAAPDTQGESSATVSLARRLGSSMSRVPEEAVLAELAREDDDPETEYARSRLKFAIGNYQALQEQIRLAKLDLDTAQAAFKYRYAMVTPPALPQKPISPKPMLILTAALVCGLLIGLVAVIAAELREGLIREPWQVERVLELRVLSDIRLPAPSEKPS